MVRILASIPPKSCMRHQVERRVRPTASSTCTTSRTTSSAYDLHNDKSCESSQRRKWRPSKLTQERAPRHQSRVFVAVLLMALIVCLSWTCWLLLLTVAPNEAINYVMRTEALDNGSFWMLVEPTPSLRALSLAGLVIVALGYLWIGSMLIAGLRQRTLTATQCGPSLTVGLQASSSPDLRQLRRGFKRSVNSLASILPAQPALRKLPSIRRLHSDSYSELWRKGSHARKIARVWMKIVDLMLQIFMLYQTLEAGFPLPLVVTCTLIVVWNAFAVVVLMYSPSPPSHIGEALVDSIDCNLKRNTCGKGAQVEALSCELPDHTATTGTLELFKSFDSTVCVNQAGPPLSIDQANPGNIPPDPRNSTFPPMKPEDEFERSVQQCIGILYRECKPEPSPHTPVFGSSSGICFSDRFMPISCSGDPNTIELRRQQIMKNIGPICNPKYEEWLGCLE
ncbi:hypothetical protein AM587_10015927 [Phytophthora nicotianae]|uniref:WLGC domain-containing protein n=1 Tax=Phytophthora nicotianae TaxID=4792 RepID=A0A0W8DVV9_PHYNI|nr:hypothetical protein AM587_10015927 [Phytophthora nicotianae]